jgi:TonB-linked SusC/RagA family outer membrane protein
MKLSFIIIFLGCLRVSAHVNGQEIFTLNMNRVSVDDVLNKIQKESDYRFFYNERYIRHLNPVSLAVKGASLSQVLDQLLDATLIYKIIDHNLVVISPRKNISDQHKIQGVVTDEKGAPLVGVTVKVKKAGLGTVTDADGKFVLVVPDDAVLEVSYIGYQMQEIPVGDQQNIHIRMKTAASGLNEVVVVGYGTQQKKDITGAVSEVNLANLKSRSYKDVQQALQGNAPGVIVQDEGGDPTSTPRVNIRGLGGVNSESPLYIVDGAIYNGGPLNPNDIASISVLKDASAAIYGARASGGVILITTKKGKSGKLTLDLDAKVGFQNAWKIPQALNAAQYAAVSNLAADNAGQPRKPVFDPAVYPDGQITRTNWMDAIFRTGKIQDYNVGLRGGSQQSNFYASFNYRKDDGILLNTYSERYNFRINSDHQITNWLKIGEHLSLSYDNGQYGTNTTSAYQGAIISAIFYPPNVSVYKPDGSFNGLPDQYAGSYGDIINPVAYLKRLDYHNPQTGIFVNPYVSIDLLKGLTFKSNLAVTRNINTSKEFDTRILETGKKFFNNTLTMGNGTTEDLLAEQTLNYEHLFNGIHSLNVLLGYTYQKSTYENFSVYAQDFDREDPQFRYFVNAQQIYPPTGGKTENAVLSYFGRVNYSYKDKYLLTGILRRDGTSKLSNSNRWEYYPSLSAGWRISEENFMEAISWLNSLKIRGSWGKLGNLASLPDNAINIPFEKLTPSILGSPATQVYGLAQNSISNPNLLWAISRQTDVGIDATFLNNRLSLSADYFKRITERMILQIPVPSTAGAANGPFVNLPGKARDLGWELAAGYHSNTERKLTYDINLSLTSVKNKVISLDDKIFPNGIGGYYDVRATLDPIRTIAGQPLYSYYVVKSAGTFKSQQEIDNYVNKDGNKIQPFAQPGDLKFIDANDDGKISPDDRVFVGSAFPDFSYGFNANVNYHGFDLNIFIQGVAGNKLFNAIKFTGLNASQQGYNMLKDILNAWSPDNPNSNIPRVSASDPNNNFGTASTWYLENGSYARLKNITLGYTLPDEISQKLHISSLRLYITGQNVITLTKYSGFDPEVGMDQYGIDLGRYPVARAFMFGISLSL